MRQIDLHAAARDLRMIEHLREIVDPAHWNAKGLEQRNPFRDRLLLHHRGQQRNQHITIAHTIMVAQETRILMKRLTRSLAELRELPVVADRHHELSIRRVEHLIRHDIGVRVTHPRRRATTDQIIHVHVGDHGDL
jgi:hypothetical protein